MSEHDELLSRKLVIEAKVEANGLTLNAKSRAVAAFDRLVGSLFDMPAAFFEGVSRKKRLHDEINERLKRAQLRVAEQQIEGMPDLGTSLINDLLEDKARKQVNAAGVVVEALDALRALPPPEEQAAGTSANDFDAELDDDWLNQFTRYAEDASSEHLQQVWGRVLAGEVRKPKSFSRHTLRFIAELDKETAENCELIRRHLIGNWILKSDQWNEGTRFLASVDMQRLGIIEGVGLGGPQQNYMIDENGNAAIAGKRWGLLVHGAPGTKLAFPVFVLTRMGHQVMSLLNLADEVASLREVEVKLDKSALKLILLGKIVQYKENQIIFGEPMEKLWGAPGT